MNTTVKSVTKQSTPADAMTLLDLNYDCLLNIFRPLSVSDLAGLSEMCRLFKDVAAETFRFEWKDSPVRLCNDSRESKLKSTEILRHFGDQLQKVEIVFDEDGNDTFFDLIINKCSGAQLTEVDFSNACFNDKAETILSKENIQRFQQKFVNLKRMRFGDNTDDITHPQCIEHHFPSLAELSLSGFPFRNENVLQFVKLNPQVKRLSFFHNNDVESVPELLESIDQQLPQLEELGLWIHGYAGDEVQYQQRFFNSLKRLVIQNCGSSTNLQRLSINNKHIEEMVLDVGACDANLIDFVCLHKELTKITIHMYYDSPFDSTFLAKLSEHLPKLSEVKIYGFLKNLIHSDIVRFVQGSKQMFKFVIGYGQRSNVSEDLEVIRNRLDATQWTVTSNLSQRQLQFDRVKGLRNA